MTRRSIDGIKNLLTSAGLRPTRQRLFIGRTLFERGNHHFTPEDLHAELVNEGLRVSLSTVYNNLHKFTSAGLLREVVVESGKTFFDSNTNPHHHFFDEDTGSLYDISEDEISIQNVPAPPEGLLISGVDVVVRVVKA
ncbi:MAG: iron response transcriptional regulator IrrA [Alphaproteobacteria bacterium]